MGDEWEKLQEIRINGLRAQVAERDELIAQVTKILGGYPDSDLLSLATTVAAGYERWSDGYDAQVEALRTQIATLWEQLAERDATILTLTERLNRCACTDDYLEITPDCTRIDAMVAESLANDSP